MESYHDIMYKINLVSSITRLVLEKIVLINLLLNYLKVL